jgi:four helix bundle protein
VGRGARRWDRGGGLVVYRVGLQMAMQVRRLAERLPRGQRSLADQMVRASQSCVLLVAEGANRLGVGEKRMRFSLARGECGECAAAVELAAAVGLVPEVDAVAVQVLASRVAAMLTRLVQRYR